MLWSAIAFLVFIVAIVLMTRRTDTVLAEPPVVVTPDSTEVATTVLAAEDSEGIVLPDSFYVTIEAAHTKVEGQYVISDSLDRRRCWIEFGEAKAFAIRERIEISNQLERIRLYADRYEIPVDTATVPLILTRDQLESMDLQVSELPDAQRVTLILGC